MAESTIEWTDATWNPTAGCSVKSAGCTNCYAIVMASRLEAMGMEKYAGLTRKSGKRRVWVGNVREDRGSLELPKRWRAPRKIFVNSMSDLFHRTVSKEFIQEVWSVMEESPRHQYQLLTKRPSRMAKMLSDGSLPMLDNVWVGTSVENAGAVHRIDALRDVPAAVRFISFEPLIGSVRSLNLTGIDWAIVGGESGHNARPIQEEWVDEIHAACKSFRTAFFFKQWGTWGNDNVKRSKKTNGRIYKGHTWDEMPRVPRSAQ